jgi:plasmid replication initiation protein
MSELVDPINITSERLVVKDNALIMASYTVTVEEQRLLLLSIEKAQRLKEPLSANAIEVSLSVQEYAETFGVKLGTAYKALSEASDKLYDRSITMNDEGVRRRVRWLQEQAVYSTGRTTLIFSTTISKHIRDIVTQRSFLRLEQATQLRSQHAIRFFEVFSMALDQETQEGTWVAGLEEIRELLDIENTYPRWADFKKRVISPSVSQINKYTSLKVDWGVAEKEGRKITKLKFIIFESNQMSFPID